MEVRVTYQEGPPKLFLALPEGGESRYPIPPPFWFEAFPNETPPGEFQVDGDRFEKLLGDVRSSLNLAAQRYLGAAERSPLAFGRWLERRCLPHAWALALTEAMREGNFLSDERYAALAMRRFEERGNTPLWIARRRLSQWGVRREVAQTAGFDELEALKRFIGRKWRRAPDLQKVAQRLRARGFSGALVREALEDLRRAGDHARDDSEPTGTP